MARPKVAVLASGEGTTVEAVIKAWAKDPNAPMVGLVICNNPNAGIFKRLLKLNYDYNLVIEAAVISGQTHPEGKRDAGEQTETEEEAILNKLLAGNFDLIWLDGYMKKVGPKLVGQFGWRPDYKSPYQAMMLNMHPGLLPATIGHLGIHVQEYVLQNKLPAGHSLHVVSENYDEGPLVTEHKVKILPNDTPKTLMDRVKASERRNLPHDIENFIVERRKYLSSES